MKKKLFLIILTIVLILFIGFNFYKLKFYKSFTTYLQNKYPENSFRVGWVKYDFIYGEAFYSKVLCKEDETKFIIRDINGVISEEYVSILSNNRYKDSLIQYFKSEAILNSISNVTPSADRSISVTFRDDQFKDNKSLAVASHEVIRVLKKNNVQLNSIAFWHAAETKLYEIRLEGEDINSQIEDIADKIRIIK